MTHVCSQTSTLPLRGTSSASCAATTANCLTRISNGCSEAKRCPGNTSITSPPFLVDRTRLDEMSRAVPSRATECTSARGKMCLDSNPKTLHRVWGGGMRGPDTNCTFWGAATRLEIRWLMVVSCPTAKRNTPNYTQASDRESCKLGYVVGRARFGFEYKCMDLKFIFELSVCCAI